MASGILMIQTLNPDAEILFVPCLTLTRQKVVRDFSETDSVAEKFKPILFIYTNANI
jgi:hypothetical protein